VRFARIREEKRHNYLRKVAELTQNHFITDDKPNIVGLILAGSANFKNELMQSDLFDKRLLPVICKVVDVSYGGENGLSQAITMSSDALSNVKFVAEKKLVSKFFQEIDLDTGMIVFGVDDTMRAMESGAVDLILLYEDLDLNRYVIKNPLKGDTKVLHLNEKQEKDPKWFKDAESGVDLEVVEMVSLAEWLCHNYMNYGCTIEFITDKSQEGFQFVKGFGGIGGFLRYKIDIADLGGNDNAGGDDFDAEEDFI